MVSIFLTDQKHAQPGRLARDNADWTLLTACIYAQEGPAMSSGQIDLKVHASDLTDPATFVWKYVHLTTRYGMTQDHMLRSASQLREADPTKHIISLLRAWSINSFDIKPVKGNLRTPL